MASAEYPLEGIRITDFGQVWAGPILSGLLANMGAEVIKIETRKRLDSVRLGPDNVERDPEKDPWFQCINRNKLSITVDFSDERGVALLKKLVKISHVVSENFSPGVLKRHGLDYDSLVKIKPDLIMVALPGAGSFGPMADLVTYGPSIVGLCGYDRMVGYEGERVLGMQQPYADVVAALYGAYSVLAAINHQQETGEGQYIELCQWEAATAVMGEALMESVMNGRNPGTLGNVQPGMAPHNNYPCQGQDKWVSIAIKTDDEWGAFCRAIGSPEWAKEERFADGFLRWQNRKEMDRLVGEWTRGRTHYEVTELLQKAGVAAAPCLSMDERLEDPHFQDRQAFVPIEHPVIGTGWVTSIPWKMSDTPGGVRTPAPLIGQHNQYVFGELLKMSQDEINYLVQEKVIY
ncbi:MAG: CoA transferase [Dehalococcoidia bacterium]|nr:CoA transferase [Dehalococcoidia bacterium]